jgi:hypothetical protein
VGCGHLQLRVVEPPDAHRAAAALLEPEPPSPEQRSLPGGGLEGRSCGRLKMTPTFGSHVPGAFVSIQLEEEDLRRKR